MAHRQTLTNKPNSADEGVVKGQFAVVAPQTHVVIQRALMRSSEGSGGYTVTSLHCTK